MVLGILSDTHGSAATAALAIRILKNLGVETFVHCGDVGGERVFDEFAGLRAYYVWGNTDWPDPGLERYAESLGLPPPRSIPLELELGERRIAVFHGHERAFARLAGLVDCDTLDEFAQAAANYDYILYGHTHCALDRRIGSVRLINPGALHRANPHTVATLDLERDRLDFWRVDADATGSAQKPFQPA